VQGRRASTLKIEAVVFCQTVVNHCQITQCVMSQKTAVLGTQYEPCKSSCICLRATGLLCHLDDACTSNPCHADAICDTSPINGSYTCSCASGYKGVDCSEDIDECEQGSPCEHDGICVNTPGSFACNCTQGFTGPRCETNVNECESHPCQNDGSCLDDPGTFRCVCMPGE
jgi:Calcium-binding EGF domain./EGF-like domain.